MSDIHKAGIQFMLTCLVSTAKFQSKANAKFIMKLREMIRVHPDKHLVKSKKIKTEALGFSN